MLSIDVSGYQKEKMKGQIEMKMSKKQAIKQHEINTYIIDVIDNQINSELCHNVYHSRLRTCSAWVYETEHFYLLKSYNTIVASYNKETHEFIDFLRYVYGFTNTSASHVSKFYNDFARNASRGLRFQEIPHKWYKQILESENGTV